MGSMVNMQLEPILLKEVANHEWNPRQTPAQPPHCIVKPWKKVYSSTTGEPKLSENERKTSGLSVVSPNGVGWGGEGGGTNQMIGA